MSFHFSPEYRKVVEGEGMPDCNEPSTRGDLIISFKIEFPKYIPKKNKALIIQALKPPKIETDKDLSNLQQTPFQPKTITS